MAYVTKFCGCEFDVEEGWEYGCAGSCCPPVTTVDDVKIMDICDDHMKQLVEKFSK